ncbi:PREDICTED: kinesin-like protein KIN-14G [Camelina sativa]|uniref:Kinesin-like protein KIN-14G n=1 Tax=Camelina sativa TaxID=90675 RepID=A0ABM0XRC3_CAMSA|nr:PREDICTED: kinesin-like protein KIN-14G [Camelina sativa]
MATEQQDSRLCLASILEDFLKQRNVRVSSVGVDSSTSTNADETSGGRDFPVDPSDLRRYEAARWIRNTLGVVGGRDLPADPSEDDFRIALRSGILLCNVLNRVKPGAVPKVVEAPNDPLVSQDGTAALSAFQYFENLRNFLVVVEEMGIPMFEVSDFEKGGKSARIVECVLALKSYREWKQSGGSGTWRYIVNSKPTTFGIAKQYKRKESEALVDAVTSSPSNTPSNEQPLFDQSDSSTKHEGSADSIDAIVRAVFLEAKQEEIPGMVEAMLKTVMLEYERRLATQKELFQMSAGNKDELQSGGLGRTISGNEELLSDDASNGEEHVTEIADNKETPQDDSVEESKIQDYELYVISKEKTKKQQMIIDRQQHHTEELKHDLKAVKTSLSLLQMKYHQEFTSLGEHLHGLAFAATSYQRVLEENRKLYNQVQDLKGSIRVYCRVRPFLPGQKSVLTTVDHIEDSTISIANPSKLGRKSFTFNKVFGPSASQEEVFGDTQPLIRSVLDGYNVCIFAYGQTGSGKTFTMMGPNELTEESLGVNYRALSDLFHLSSVRKETFSYSISVQMLEIYNEQVRDLLATNGQTSRLEIRNSSQDGINVPEATLVPVSTTSDVIHLMNIGQKNRAVSATAMNDRSSRSHSCLTVHVQGKDLTSGATLRGSMHLVDLAGSERVDKSEVTGDRLKEAQHINKSLSALGDVIASLSQKNNHIPYRNSKLTQLLQDALGGQAKTLMFVHISPEQEALGETLSTLKFAERVATVELGAARVNKDTSEVKELKEQIASLKLALARKENEAADQTQLPRPLTPDKLLRRKSLGVSSSFSKSANTRQFQTKHKTSSQIDDANSIEGQSDSASSLDLQGLAGSPSWKSPSRDEKEEETEFISGSEWIDKHEDEITRNGKPENRSHTLGDQKRSSSLKREPTRGVDNNVVGKGFEVKKVPFEEEANESDETATSDCSETNLMWQLNVQVNMPRASSNGSSTTKLKKTQSKISRVAAETRSMIPSLIPTPTRRLSLGSNTPGQTSSRHNSTVVVKKRQNPK